ncbi:ABC transporter ATP-binding protein/permease [Methylocapsa palsarum]|uniref:Putative ATP-binding cassette transporter n=1 Tax=Methylocapsa palsarum TaxID=1612308 RepID=A0A1I3WWW2_9HYPH|nr:ABC transporter ATP-binding protein/permease [Methylocapsa palsarum]SFK11026.1 putative ATP-binding cassette transporter [Methylocapsa palsarum]
MKILAALVALVSVAAAIIGVVKGDNTLHLVAAAGLLCAYTTFRSPDISRFLQIFVSIFATETILFGVLFLVAQIGFWPDSLDDYVLPESLPLTVAIFAILVYALSFVPVVRSMTAIADRYFNAGDPTRARVWPFPSYSGTERGVAVAMVVLLVLINQAQVGVQVRLSFFSRDWFNAVQNKDEAAFWAQLISVFLPWAFLYIGMAVVEYVVQSTLIIRWRRWLTDNYVGRWLDRHTHYRISLEGGLADNPDQRIAEDVNRFIDGGQTGYGIYSFSILLISTLSSLVSFAIVLWDLSRNFTLPGTSIAVPGFLFWVALIYAGVGTLITHLIGRPLVALAFAQQRYEADFRFSLARLREYAEQVALLAGEPTEKVTLKSRFGAIVTNYFRIVGVRKNLTAFTAFYGQLSPFIPYIVAAPFYFAGKITLGVMTQTARAFSSVEGALTFFITYYVSLAEFKAVLDRLTSFDTSIEAGKRLGEPSARAAGAGADLTLDDLSLRLPNGRQIVKDASLSLARGESALLTGPSGSGKSTLFRAISGIWPFGEGQIDLPAGARVMLLPQKPYVPIGSLLAAVTYPAEPESFSEDKIKDALAEAKLSALISQLHVEDNWAQRLSGGEQQRLAIARALLAKPDWLFLDEATAAMDEAMEAEIYEILFKALPETTIVSIGHRASLMQFHHRRLQMKPAGDGIFTPVADVKAAE